MAASTVTARRTAPSVARHAGDAAGDCFAHAGHASNKGNHEFGPKRRARTMVPLPPSGGERRVTRRALATRVRLAPDMNPEGHKSGATELRALSAGRSVNSGLELMIPAWFFRRGVIAIAATDPAAIRGLVHRRGESRPRLRSRQRHVRSVLFPDDPQGCAVRLRNDGDLDFTSFRDRPGVTSPPRRRPTAVPHDPASKTKSPHAPLHRRDAQSGIAAVARDGVAAAISKRWLDRSY